MTEFHNPYHFVPISADLGPGAIALELDARGFRQPKSWPDHLTHDRFITRTFVDGNQEEVFSGRIICQAIIKDCLALGADQFADDNNPREVSLFKIDGQYALSGSALRGMLSSLAEAASNSTLRILENSNLSLKPGGGAPTSPGGTLYAFYRQVNPELVPLQEGDARKCLTIAEQLFGVVEERPDNPSNSKRSILSLASRVRISNALAHGKTPTAGSEAITKILASPKYRYPSFHFNKTTDGEFIARDQLKLNQGHFPKGRKFYLHRKEQLSDKPGVDWVTRDGTARRNQKAHVIPLRTGEFWFHVDFDNLSLLELELLCYALRPKPSFMHMLGMGKPLGLGKLEINTAGLFLVDRTARYSRQNLTDARYHRVWCDTDHPPSLWPASYQTREATAPATEPAASSPRVLADNYRKRVQEKRWASLWPILQAIELLGDPEKVRCPVHYPQVPNQNQDLEQNLFRWFQQNEVQQGQFLRPLTDANTCGFKELPTLDRQPSPQPPTPSCWSSGKSSATSVTPATTPVTAAVNPAAFSGQALQFRLAQIKPNGKMRFEITFGGITYNGALQSPAHLQELHKQRLPVGVVVTLKVLNYVNQCFQLALP